MKILRKNELMGIPTLTFKDGGADDDPNDIVTKAVSDLTQTVETRLSDIEKKSDPAPLVARLDKLEAKMNRPPSGGDSGEEPSDEQKAFVSYLQGRDYDRKALTTTSDTTDHILAPEDMQTDFIRNLVEFSPIRTIAEVRSTTSASVILPKRTGVTNAVWVDEQTTRTGSQPAFDQAKIAIKEIATYVDISLQLAEDSANVLSEVNMALAEDFGQKEALAFVEGDGVLEPAGFMTDIAFMTGCRCRSSPIPTRNASMA